MVKKLICGRERKYLSSHLATEEQFGIATCVTHWSGQVTWTQMSGITLWCAVAVGATYVGVSSPSAGLTRDWAGHMWAHVSLEQ